MWQILVLYVRSQGFVVDLCFCSVFSAHSVQFDGKVVVSGAYDFLVKVWNPIEGTCIHTLQGHTNRVYSLLVRTISFVFVWPC